MLLFSYLFPDISLLLCSSLLQLLVASGSCYEASDVMCFLQCKIYAICVALSTRCGVPSRG